LTYNTTKVILTTFSRPIRIRQPAASDEIAMRYTEWLKNKIKFFQQKSP